MLLVISLATQNSRKRPESLGYEVSSLFQKGTKQNLNTEMGFVLFNVVSSHLVEWKMQAVSHTVI